MRRTKVDPPLAFGLDPSAQNAPAWKGNRADAHVVDNRKLQIAVERRSGYRVPHNSTSGPLGSDRVTLLRRSRWVAGRYSELSAELKFSNSNRTEIGRF